MKYINLIGLAVLVGLALSSFAGRQEQEEPGWVKEARNRIESKKLGKSIDIYKELDKEARLALSLKKCPKHKEHLKKADLSGGMNWGYFCSKGQIYYIQTVIEIREGGMKSYHSSWFGPFSVQDKKSLQENFQKLIEQLSSKDKKVRAKAEAKLKKLGPAALVALERALSDTKWIKEGKCQKKCVCSAYHEGRMCQRCKGRSGACTPKKEIHNLCYKCAKELGICGHCQRNQMSESRQLTSEHKKWIKKLAGEIRAELDKQIKDLLRDLDDNDPEKRNKATEELIEVGKMAKSYVRKAVEAYIAWAKEKKKIEVQERCKQILKELRKSEFSKNGNKWIKEGVCPGPPKCGGLCPVGEPKGPCPRCKKNERYINLSKICYVCAEKLRVCATCLRKSNRK